MNRWRSRTAWMAGTRPAMTAEAGPSTVIAIRAKINVPIFRNLCYYDSYAGSGHGRNTSSNAFVMAHGKGGAPRFRALPAQKGARIKATAKFPSNPLKRLISDERIQANPSKSKLFQAPFRGSNTVGHRAAKKSQIRRLSPPEQPLDVGKLELDIGRAAVIALASARRRLHCAQERVHFVRLELPP